MMLWKKLNEEIARNGYNTDDFWIAEDCINTVMAIEDIAYKKAIQEKEIKADTLYDELNIEETALTDMCCYAITDYWDLHNRFYFSYGQILAYLEFVAPNSAEEHFKTIQHKFKKFLTTPTIECAHNAAKQRYQQIREYLYKSRGGEQLNAYLEAAHKKSQLCNVYFLYIGYVMCRLRWAEGKHWNKTALYKAITQYCENRKV